jgi:hypothetical protein
VVDISRARALGYEPAVALEQGLKSVWSDLGDAGAAAGEAGAKAPEPAGTPGS